MYPRRRPSPFPFHISEQVPSPLSSGSRLAGRGPTSLSPLFHHLLGISSFFSFLFPFARAIMVWFNFSQRGHLIVPQNLSLFQVYINAPVEGPKILSVFSRTSLRAPIRFPYIYSASVIAFVLSTRIRIVFLSITRAAFVLVPHLSPLTSCRPRATRPAAHPRSL